MQTNVHVHKGIHRNKMVPLAYGKGVVQNALPH